MASVIEPYRDKQSVTSDGVLISPRIDGLIIHRRPPVEDARGDVTEMYNPAWGLHPDPLVYVYQVCIRPGSVKGWVVHQNQDDRLFMVLGVMRWAFFDNRADSPTYKLVNDVTISDRHRALIIVPRGVYHAVKNIGPTEAYFVNMPTAAYHHAEPDKYRLPARNDLIPFDFDDATRW